MGGTAGHVEYPLIHTIRERCEVGYLCSHNAAASKLEWGDPEIC
jgi:hypothetical protein